MKCLNQTDIRSRDSYQVTSWTAVGSVLEYPQPPDLPRDHPAPCSVNTNDSFPGCVAVTSSQSHAYVKNVRSLTSITSYAVIMIAGTRLGPSLCISAGPTVLRSSHFHTLNANIILTSYARAA